MSLSLMRRVLANSKAREGARLTLLLLAYHADDSGKAWPGLELLARETGLSRRGLLDALARLERSGELTIEHGRGRGRHNVYRCEMGEATSPFLDRVKGEVRAP